MTLRGALPWGLLALGALGVAGLVARRGGDETACGPGFTPVAARCCPQASIAAPAPAPDHAIACEAASSACPSPLVAIPGGCDAPDRRVLIPETSIVFGSSDWEAEGKVPARTVHVRAFRIDAFEATEHAVRGTVRDGARAASGVSRGEAAAFCATRGGRLPSEDEWVVAAAGAQATRYPWGETGAVCRRAAWGLQAGPCSSRGSGPDTVGSHADGDTPTGLHDMAGNVAEWVGPAAPSPSEGVAHGGSWATAFAAELRTWSVLRLSPSAHDGRVGVRCAYDGPG